MLLRNTKSSKTVGELKLYFNPAFIFLLTLNFALTFWLPSDILDRYPEYLPYYSSHGRHVILSAIHGGISFHAGVGDTTLDPGVFTSDALQKPGFLGVEGRGKVGTTFLQWALLSVPLYILMIWIFCFSGWSMEDSRRYQLNSSRLELGTYGWMLYGVVPVGWAMEILSCFRALFKRTP